MNIKTIFLITEDLFLIILMAISILVIIKGFIFCIKEKLYQWVIFIAVLTLILIVSCVFLINPVEMIENMVQLISSGGWGMSNIIINLVLPIIITIALILFIFKMARKFK